MDFHRIKSVLSQHTPSQIEWKGAVVFLCNEEHVFLIKRSEQMPTHSGQIAFVGGHKLAAEILPWEVAQREFEEETGHTRDMLGYLGDLPLVFTAHRQPIIPVMAKLTISTEKFLSDVRSNGEWDEILAYPWKELLREESWDYAWRYGLDKSAVMFHPIKSGSYLSPHESANSHLLWGATAHVIWGFLRLYFNK